jgi:hypothetical protein
VLERVLTDGQVSIRPSSIDDVPALIAGRDAEFERFLALASRAGFDQCGDLDGNPYWKKRLDPPLSTPERRDRV